MKSHIKKTNDRNICKHRSQSLRNGDSNASEPKSFLDKQINFITAHKKIVAIILGMLGSIIIAADYILDYIYRIQCEKFYHIPNLYFSINGKDYLLRCAIAIAIFAVIVELYGYLSNKKSKERDIGDTVDKAFFSLVGGLFLGFFNVAFVLNWLENPYYMHFVLEFADYLGDILLPIIILPMPTFCGLFLIKSNSKNKNVQRVRRFCAIILAIQFIIYIAGTFRLIGVDVKEKHSYEIVTIDNQEYVVLSHYDNDILLAKYKVEDGVPVFITSEYCLKDKNAGVLRYEYFKEVPRIR